ncbi:MAG: TetR/AcrR family transcriptional regulator [Verrucomicrobia bacterium]|nr:MAG: TetR/AcrR family transcriptional regulator [Verrucomicrobiota bacterium]
MASRKQTQIAERETAILDIAGRILAREGMAALTMERVLAEVDFSKGTLYNHFRCREDLLIAWHARCFRQHFELFARGALFRGRPRERFLAVGIGDEIKHALDPVPAAIVMTEEILAGASEHWRETFVANLREGAGLFEGIVRDGIASGDLSPEHDPEIVASAAWSVWVGARELHHAGMILRGRPAEEFATIRGRMVAILLDGFGWKPLSTEHDYDAVRRRILEEVYRPEATQLGWLPGDDSANS